MEINPRLAGEGAGKVKTKEEPFGKVIYAYTRAQAIEDGVLVDAGGLAAEAGLLYPVAVTRTLYDGYIVPKEKEIAQGQSVTGRFWDVVWMLGCKIRGLSLQEKKDADILFYDVIFSGKSQTLKCVCSPGDTPAPVLTIMLPDED